MLHGRAGLCMHGAAAIMTAAAAASGLAMGQQLAALAVTISLLVVGALAPATRRPLLAPRHQLTNATGRADGPDAAPMGFHVGDDGGILLLIDGHNATVSSSFASQDKVCAFGHTPYGVEGGWTAPPTVDRTVPGRVRVRGISASFSVDRLIVSDLGRILVNDTIIILRTDVAGNATVVQQSHSATFGPASEINYTSVDGPNDEYAIECVSESPGMYGSPSVFVAAQKGAGRHVGLGLLALDDVFGLHARAINAAVNSLGSNCAVTSPFPSVSLQDMQFGLRSLAGTTHTAEWSIYGTGTGCTTSDPYWCFANAVRQDMGVSGSLRIEGNGILNAMRWGDRLAPLGYKNAREWRQWSPEQMGAFLDTNAFDWVASDIPWNLVNNQGSKGNLCEPGNPHYEQGSGFVNEAGADCIQYIRDLVKAVKTARPHVKVVVYFHAFLSGESNATEKYPHDRILDDQGSAVCWDSSKCTRKDSCDELAYFFGTTTNKYGRQLDAYIDKVFALGADGIYHDESAYSVTSQHGKDFGQLIYNPSLPWDGVTVATTTTGGSCAGSRPKPPCKSAGWFVGSNGICEQGCPLNTQGRDPRSGRCLCGKGKPDTNCLAGFNCIEGQCCSGSGKGGRPAVTGLPSMTGLVRLQHKKELYARVFKKGGLVVANDPPVTRTFRRWLVEQARLHTRTGGKQGGVAVHFAETGQQVRGRVTHFFTPVMLDRCGTEGQSPDDDPKYNHTVGISAGLNVGAHLDYGTLSVMCTEPMANSSHNILQAMYPITPTVLGPGTVVGVERTVTKVSGAYCWHCDEAEQLTAQIFDAEGFLVRTQRASTRIEVQLDMAAGQIAVISRDLASYGNQGP